MTPVEMIGRWFILLIYAGSFFYYERYFREKIPAMGKKANRIFTLALFLHTIGVIFLWISEGYFPIMNVDYAIFTWMWIFGLFYWVLEWRLHEQSFGIFITSLLILLLFISNLIPNRQGPFPNYFRDPWIQIHIFLMLVAYTGFAISFIASSMYLMLFKELKNKKLRFFYSRLPALELLDKLGLESLTAGFVFLTIGIFVALSIGSQYLTQTWYLDSKIISVFATWILYAVYLGVRWFFNASPRKSAYLSIFSFGWILVSFFVVSTVVSNVHAY